MFFFFFHLILISNEFGELKKIIIVKKLSLFYNHKEIIHFNFTVHNRTNVSSFKYSIAS